MMRILIARSWHFAPWLEFWLRRGEFGARDGGDRERASDPQTGRLPLGWFQPPREVRANQSKIFLASTRSCENAGNVFMATNTFGRRGVVAPTARGSFQPASFQPVAAPIAPGPASDEEPLFGENKLLADIPFLTIGLIFGLLLIYAVQRSLAIDTARDGSLDVRSLIADGATSYDLVVGQGRVVADRPCAASAWQRLAPDRQLRCAVHRRRQAGASDRPWLVSLIFVASALAGEAGSLLGNGARHAGCRCVGRHHRADRRVVRRELRT